MHNKRTMVYDTPAATSDKPIKFQALKFRKNTATPQNSPLY